MPLPAPVRERIQHQIDSSQVVLFMKGTHTMPRCGFSATVVGMLDELGVDFRDIDVLDDPDVRQGIKEFSDWPTIPQLYIGGEFLGGSDIVREMYANGELHQKLGLPAPERFIPSVQIHRGAAEALHAAAVEADPATPDLKLEIDAAFGHNLFFGRRGSGDIAVTAGGITLYVDAISARRADGLNLDFVDGPDGTGFKIDNPNGPAA